MFLWRGDRVSLGRMAVNVQTRLVWDSEIRLPFPLESWGERHGWPTSPGRLWFVRIKISGSWAKA